MEIARHRVNRREALIGSGLGYCLGRVWRQPADSRDSDYRPIRRSADCTGQVRCETAGSVDLHDWRWGYVDWKPHQATRALRCEELPFRSFILVLA